VSPSNEKGTSLTQWAPGFPRFRAPVGLVGQPTGNLDPLGSRGAAESLNPPGSRGAGEPNGSTNPLGSLCSRGDGCCPLGQGAVVPGISGSGGGGEGQRVRVIGDVGTTEPVKFFSKSKTQWVPYSRQPFRCTAPELRCTLPPTMEQGHPHSLGTVVTGETPLPNWLSCPDPKPPRPLKERLALEQTQYEIVFQTVIEQMCEGVTLTAALQSFPHDISRGNFECNG
jgi:hypothetical protein